MSSSYEEKFYCLLKTILPLARVYKQYFVKYKGHKIFFDFYLPSFNIAVEIHGQQHYNYIEFFHKDKFDFLFQGIRDNLKAEWCDLKGIKLIEISSTDLPKNTEELLNILVGE